MFRNWLLVAALTVTAFVPSAWAGSDLVLSLDSTAAVGGLVPIDVTFDNNFGLVAGWSFGVCHTEEVEVDNVAIGSTTATIQDGAAPDFESTVLWPGQGWSTGVVIDFQGMSPLAMGEGYQLYVAEYTVNGAPGDVAELTFCGDEFPLPVDTVISSDAGASFIPLTLPGEIELLDQTFWFTIENQSAFYDLASGIGAFDLCATIREDAENDGFPNSTVAFSMSLGYDTALLTAIDAVASGALLDLNGGAGPDFFAANTLSDSITVGCVYAFGMDQPVSYDVEKEVACFQFETVPSALAGDDIGTTTNLVFAASGDPQVDNTVAVGVTPVQGRGVGGEITLEPGGTFVRGDTNGDGTVDVSDPVFDLAYQFQGGPLNCLVAHDTNDDGAVDVADPVYTLAFLFQGGTPILAPFPDCGSDPTPDSLTCDTPPGSCP